MVNIDNHYYLPSVAKHSFRLWWNRKGHKIFCDYLRFEQYNINLMDKTVKEPTERSILLKKEKIDNINYNGDAEEEGKLLIKQIGAQVFRTQPNLIKAFEKEFPKKNCFITKEEQEAINNLSDTKQKYIQDLFEEVNEVQSLQFIPKTDTTVEYFNAQISNKNKESKKKKITSLINPHWVKYCFNMKYYGLLQSCPGKWIPVPIGASRDECAPPNLTTPIICKYFQGENKYCIIYGLTNALYYIGFIDKAKNC